MKEYIFKQYLGNILEHLGITLEDLLEETKTRTIVEARYILYYLCQERGMTLSEIKSYMETQGFEVTLATMMKGVVKAKDIIDNDPDYKYIVKKLENIEL
jgi:chromosomal replication initiation ATPase DnaA